MAHFGNILRRLIEASPWQLTDFAGEAGISEATLHRQLASEKPRGNKDTRTAIAEIVNLTHAELMDIFAAEERLEGSGLTRQILARAGEIRPRKSRRDHFAPTRKMDDLGGAVRESDENSLGGMRSLPQVIDWFKQLSTEDRQAVMQTLDAYSGNLLADLAKAVQRFGDRLAASEQFQQPKKARKAG